MKEKILNILKHNGSITGQVVMFNKLELGCAVDEILLYLREIGCPIEFNPEPEEEIE